MRITFDPAKREWTLHERGLDFAEAIVVFSGPSFTFADDRFDYPEPRFITVGQLAGRMVVLVWTPDENVEGDGRRVISLRKANAREQRRFRQQLGETRRDDG